MMNSFREMVRSLTVSAETYFIYQSQRFLAKVKDLQERLMWQDHAEKMLCKSWERDCAAQYDILDYKDEQDLLEQERNQQAMEDEFWDDTWLSEEEFKDKSESDVHFDQKAKTEHRRIMDAKHKPVVQYKRMKREKDRKPRNKKFWDMAKVNPFTFMAGDFEYSEHELAAFEKMLKKSGNWATKRQRKCTLRRWERQEKQERKEILAQERRKMAALVELRKRLEEESRLRETMTFVEWARYMAAKRKETSASFFPSRPLP